MSDVKPITLDDLMPVEVTLSIKQVKYNRELKVPIVTLSWEEWDAIGREVPDPAIPSTKLAEDGVTLLPNPQDKRYLEQMARAYEDRYARRIFRCLEKGGNVFPGETALEKYKNLKNADFAMCNALCRGIIEANMVGRSELEQLAESFLAESVSQNDDAYPLKAEPAY